MNAIKSQHFGSIQGGRTSARFGNEEVFVNIEHFTAKRLTMVFAAMALAGCAVDADSDIVEGEEVAQEANAVSVTVDCKANSSTGYAGPNYERAISATPTTVIDAVDGKTTVFDISGYCASAINARRQTNHTRIRNGTPSTLNPYYSLYYTGSAPAVVPAYSTIGFNINETTGPSACRLCKGLADAVAPGHPNYGSCYGGWDAVGGQNVNGPTLNDNSVGACGAGVGQTAQQVVDNCLNSFENEDGGGHKGPIIWDSSRGIACTIAVYVDPVTGAKTAGVRMDYSWPTRAAAQPNGGNCKVSGECLSKRCNGATGRCEGFTSSIRVGSSAVTNGVSTCPLTDSKNCTEHPEDPTTCVSKNLACASGVCGVTGVCAKGATGKPCVVNGDCSSNVCSTSKTCT